MVKKWIDRARTMERDFLLFMMAGVFLGLGQSVDSSSLNNFMKDNFHIDILHRSALEMPRELPGFLVFLVIGFLFMLGDVRIAAIANLFAAGGMFLLGIIPAKFVIMVGCIFIYSMGQHVYMPLSNSIGMSFANDGRLGRKLGQISAANTAALVISSAVLWALFNFVHINYRTAFTIGAVSFLAASISLFLMNPKQTVKLKNRFVFRKEYRLFYWLSVLFGARKQIFITFGPWVLIDVFKQKVATMALLAFLIAFSGIFIKPLIGSLIDKVGERFVLGGEAAILIVVCLGYAFASNLLPVNWAIVAVCICFILDQTLSSVGMARATYLKKIAVKDEDVSTTLSLGISIDHIVSMFIPTLGGIVWYSNGENGYKIVFIAGAFIALVNFISTRKIRIDENMEGA